MSSGPATPPGPRRGLTAPSLETVGLWALFLLALGLRLAGAGWSLPQVYEEAVPSKVAWSLWAWGESHGFDGNPRTFGYPSLVFYLHFIGQALLYVGLRLTGAIHSAAQFRVLYALDKTPFMLVGRSISALFGAGLVPVTWALARRLAGPAAGGCAALFAAVAPALVLRATEIEVDLPVTLFVTLGSVCSLRLLESPTARNSLLAGLLAGLAASSKYPGAIALVPCAAAILLAPAETLTGHEVPGVAALAAPRRQGRKPAGGGPPPRRTRTWTARARLLAVAVAAALTAFFATSPYILLDRAEFVRDYLNQREHMALGHFGVESGPAFAYNMRALGDRLLGWPIALLAVTGIVVLALWERRRQAIVVASLPVAYLAIVGTWTMKADRYLLLVVPTAMVLAAAAAAWAISRIRPAARGPRQTLVWVLVVAACAAPFAVQIARGALSERFRPDTRTEALRWVQQHAPEGAFVAMEQYGPNLANLTVPELVSEVAPYLKEFKRRPSFYAVQFIPMFQVEPERSAPFYDLGLYGAADLLVVTSSVRSRYEADRARYGRQCAFYDSLDGRWPRVASFSSAGHSGPDILIYRNPDHDGWFPSRRDLTGPRTVGDSHGGMENYFYWNLGVNYEACGYFGHAIEAYRIALGYAPRPTDMELYASVATRLTYCLLRTRAPGPALAYLDEAGQQAKLPIEAEALAWAFSKLREDAGWFAKLEVPRLGG